MGKRAILDAGRLSVLHDGECKSPANRGRRSTKTAFATGGWLAISDTLDVTDETKRLLVVGLIDEPLARQGPSVAPEIADMACSYGLPANAEERCNEIARGAPSFGRLHKAAAVMTKTATYACP